LWEIVTWDYGVGIVDGKSGIFKNSSPYPPDCFTHFFVKDYSFKDGVALLPLRGKENSSAA
jgi:hypothetical protein